MPAPMAPRQLPNMPPNPLIQAALALVHGGVARIHTVIPGGGGDHTTLADALAVVQPGQALEVYPGDYYEDLPVPFGVTIQGRPDQQLVVIHGSSPTSTKVTLSDFSVLKDITIAGPSGSNPGIDATGLSSIGIAILFQVAYRAGGGTGPAVLGAGSGTLVTLGGFYHVSGDTGPVFKIDSGRAMLESTFGTGGATTAFVEVTGGEFLPTASESVLATFLASIGGPVPAFTYRLILAAQGIPGGSDVHFGDSADVPGTNFRHRFLVLPFKNKKLPYPFGTVLVYIPDMRVAVNSARIYPEIGKLTDIRVGSGLEYQGSQWRFRCGFNIGYFGISGGGYLCFLGRWQVIANSIQQLSDGYILQCRAG